MARMPCRHWRRGRVALPRKAMLAIAVLTALTVSYVPAHTDLMPGPGFTSVTTEPDIFIPGGTGAELLLGLAENFHIPHVKDGDVHFRKYVSHSLSVPDTLLFGQGENKRIDATFDDLGLIHLTWSTDYYGAWSTMYLRIDSNGTIVVPAAKLSGNNSAWDFASVIAVNSLGQAFVAWDHWWNPADPYAEDVLYSMIDTDGNVLFTQEYVAPEGWSTAFYGKKDIVVDRNDSLHIIFDRQYQNFDIEVYYKKFASDGTTVLVSEKKLLPTVYEGWASAMEAVLDSQDRINIGHTYGVPGGVMETFFSRIDLEGNLEVSPTPLSTQDQFHSHQAYLAMDANDNSYVFWRETKDGNGEVYYAVVDQNGSVVLSSSRLTYSPQSDIVYYMGAAFDALGSCYWSYYNENGTYVVYPVAPVADAGGPYMADEGGTIVLNAGGSYDENGDAIEYRWDLDGNGVWETNWSSNASLAVVWGDDYNGTVRVEVRDGRLSDSDVATVTVHNLAPVIGQINWSSRVGGEPRTVGYWRHQCRGDLKSPDHVGIRPEFVEHISENSTVFVSISTVGEVCAQLDNTGNANMTRKAMRQLMALWLNVVSGKLDLLSEDFVDELNGTISLQEMMAWIEQVIMAGDFGAMEKAKDLADATNNGQLFSQGGITTTAEVADPGSDDLFFTWEWGDGTSTEHTYYNDGVGPDPYPSPDVNPTTITDTARHSYTSAGTYKIILTVTDDDGGIVASSFVLMI